MKKTIQLIALFVMVGVNQASAASEQITTGTSIYAGTFMPVGTKHTEGSLTIEQRIDGTYLKLGSDFDTQEGPDLRVVLRDSMGKTQMLVLESLKAFSGQQEYKLPVMADDLVAFDQVVIYCAEFHVDFGIAALESH